MEIMHLLYRDYRRRTADVQMILKNVFLEVALFNPNSVAQTGRTLGINSDARYRFERGLDKNMVIEGLNMHHI